MWLVALVVLVKGLATPTYQAGVHRNKVPKGYDGMTDLCAHTVKHVTPANSRVLTRDPKNNSNKNIVAI